MARRLSGRHPRTRARQAHQSAWAAMVGQCDSQGQPHCRARIRRMHCRLCQLRTQPRAQLVLRRRNLRAVYAAGIPGARLRPQAVQFSAASDLAQSGLQSLVVWALSDNEHAVAFIARSQASRWPVLPNGSEHACSTRSPSPGPADFSVIPGRAKREARIHNTGRQVYAVCTNLTAGLCIPALGLRPRPE